ncbi:hypothetical protein GCM10023100_44660 [Actinocorallia cavernae]|uniref:Uncharacterized protein n=2 Tax=Actinomycetes TaxID=1760 RepID=A0ABP8STY1_9ACTN
MAGSAEITFGGPPPFRRDLGLRDPVDRAAARVAFGCGLYRDAVLHDPVVRDPKDQRTGERTEPAPTAPVTHSAE